MDEVAEGIEIPYWIIVEADIPEVVPLPQDIGLCTDAGPSGLNVFEYVSGGDQAYCLCDVGPCGAPPPAPAMVVAGQTPASFSWDGVNWYGPSDWDSPKGRPFPAGVYTLEISAIGTVAGVDFEVRNQFEITLTR